MYPRDLVEDPGTITVPWYMVFSMVLFPWVLLYRALPDVVLNPFPAAVIASVFAVPYHFLVLGDDFAYTFASGVYHISLAFLVPFDLSWKSILGTFAFFSAYAIMTDFGSIYALKLPNTASRKTPETRLGESIRL